MLLFPFGEHVELLEERLVVAALGLLFPSLVDGCCVVGQLQGDAQMRAVELERGFGLGQRFMRGGQFVLQNSLLALEDGGADRLLREAHLDKTVLLGFQGANEPKLGLFDLDDRLLADANQRLDCRRAALHLLRRELDGPLHVVALDGLLDELWIDACTHRAACALDPPDAEVVGVVLAGAAPAQGVDEPPPALAAEQRATQVVLALLRTLTGDPLFIEPGLYEVKGVLVNQRLMPTLKDLLIRRTALVDNQSQIVAVAQDALEGCGIDLLRGAVAARTGAQPGPVQLICKLAQGVLAGGVELERQRQEVVAVRVGGHGGDPATISQAVHIVEIAEVRPAVSAANAGLLLEAALDVLAGLHRLELVLRGDHALVKESGGAVLAGHWLGDRDQPSASFADDLARLPMIDGIARPPGQAPDNHVVHASCCSGIASL